MAPPAERGHSEHVSMLMLPNWADHVTAGADTSGCRHDSIDLIDRTQGYVSLKCATWCLILMAEDAKNLMSSRSRGYLLSCRK